MGLMDAEPAAEKQENGTDDSAPASLPVIGIIYPPPEVRSILFVRISDQRRKILVRVICRFPYKYF